MKADMYARHLVVIHALFLGLLFSIVSVAKGQPTLSPGGVTVQAEFTGFLNNDQPVTWDPDSYYLYHVNYTLPAYATYSGGRDNISGSDMKEEIDGNVHASAALGSTSISASTSAAFSGGFKYPGNSDVSGGMSFTSNAKSITTFDVVGSGQYSLDIYRGSLSVSLDGYAAEEEGSYGSSPMLSSATVAATLSGPDGVIASRGGELSLDSLEGLWSTTEPLEMTGSIGPGTYELRLEIKVDGSLGPYWGAFWSAADASIGADFSVSSASPPPMAAELPEPFVGVPFLTAGAVLLLRRSHAHGRLNARAE